AGIKPHSCKDVPKGTGMAENFHRSDGSGGEHLVQKKDCDRFHTVPENKRLAQSPIYNGISAILLQVHLRATLNRRS
ncbi:MAG: hypothetical protein DMG68_12405, partial [Acidobacteria bacterium]